MIDWLTIHSVDVYIITHLYYFCIIVPYDASISQEGVYNILYIILYNIIPNIVYDIII